LRAFRRRRIRILRRRVVRFSNRLSFAMRSRIPTAPARKPPQTSHLEPSTRFPHPAPPRDGSNEGMPPPDDAALLAAFRAGEQSAFEAIVRRHRGALIRLAERRCGGGALAEDAVQTGLIRAHAYLLREGDVANLGAWLRRVVYNCATDLLERERQPAARPPESRAAPAAAFDRLERKELRGIVARAIDRLPDLYREPLRLRYLEGVDAREIAALLQDNLNSIKSRLARGRRELRRRLGDFLGREGYL